MDYVRQSLSLKLRKATRYTRLYGPRRTLAKVKSQYHMKRRFDPLPTLSTPTLSGGHVGFIGSGNFPFSTLAYYLRKDHGRVIRAAMDIDAHRAASLYREYGLRYYTDDAQRIVDDPEIDLVFVVSNHATHADYAVAALEAGKAVHVEKPHATDAEQLGHLCETMARTGGRLSIGFNRPCSPMFGRIQEHLAGQEGAAVFNWFVVGHRLPPDHWYLKPGEGSRVLGNLCHWTDFVYRLVPPDRRYPITITPTRGDVPDRDLAVTYTFGDGTVAAITFSEKGYTFEGVRESFRAQRGDVLVFLEDFDRLTIENGPARHRWRPLFRDHGHHARVRASYALAGSAPGKTDPGDSIRYVWESGDLFLKTDQALRDGRSITVNAFEDGKR